MRLCTTFRRKSSEFSWIVPMVALDTLDRKILRALQRDGRITNTELAERIGLSASACLRRVKRLEDEGVIGGYTAVLDQIALGKPASIFVEITLASQSEASLSAFEAAVRVCPEVMECHLMSGSADYLLRFVAADTLDFERIHKIYLTRLPGVARIRSAFSLRTVSRRAGFPLGD
ncbi:AsnC family transcriptional regulator [Rhodospirillum rubrum]|nr:AsnC family transcriptional regulator [Rhodospirillum rubrum]MBK1677307.1 AsnC family transcriptional regulator [Rhodospirillum rubrum]